MNPCPAHLKQKVGVGHGKRPDQLETIIFNSQWNEKHDNFVKI